MIPALHLGDPGADLALNIRLSILLDAGLQKNSV